MSKCYFCKNELQKNTPCANCGAILTQSLCSMKFPESKRDYSQRDVYYTEKYIFSKKVSSGLMMGGLVGGLIGAAVDVKKSFEVYDVSNVMDIIYPIEYKGIKKNSAIKFVDRNGEDFITTFTNMKTATAAYETLRNAYLKPSARQQIEYGPSVFCGDCGNRIDGSMLFCTKCGAKAR